MVMTSVPDAADGTRRDGTDDMSEAAGSRAPEPMDRDAMAAHAGVVSESEHEALRADIRTLSTLLGQTVAHQGGPQLLELIEEVRTLSRAALEEDGAATAEINRVLSELDAGTAVVLARAFSQYFQLANIAEQVHRSRELRTLRPVDRRPLRTLMQRLAHEFTGAGRAEVNAVLRRAELRPVFTAHPTESSRQSVLATLRRVAEALDRGARVFKVHLQVGAFDPRDPLLDDVWARLAERGVPVVVHCGGGPVPGPYTGPGPFGEVLARHPRLVAVVAHLGMPEYGEFLALARRYEGVHLDTTMAFTDFTEQRMPFPRSLVPALVDLQDRVVLGSDFPNTPYPYLHQLEALTGLGLGEAWLRAVLHDNGARLLRLDAA